MCILREVCSLDTHISRAPVGLLAMLMCVCVCVSWCLAALYCCKGFGCHVENDMQGCACVYMQSCSMPGDRSNMGRERERERDRDLCFLCHLDSELCMSWRAS
jgi:hypothetical protein